MYEAATLNQLSQETMAKGSKSFSMAAKFFSKEEFESATRIYYWCRHCDDVIDDKVAQAKDLAELHTSTFVNSDQPQFVAFRQTREKYQIPDLYPSELLEGMRMDIEQKEYQTLDELKLYCYRVAGTVGLMMCHVMGIFSEEALPQAGQLGMGMQLTNIARDVKEDFERGRIYLPQEWLRLESIPSHDLLNPQYRGKLFEVVKRLLMEAEVLYEQATSGLEQLPLRSALAVTMAMNIYREIGREILKVGPPALDSRTIISKKRKIQLVIKSIFQIMLSLPSRMLKNKRVVNIQKTWSLS